MSPPLGMLPAHVNTGARRSVGADDTLKSIGTWQAERADAYATRMVPIPAELQVTQARRMIERLARLRGAAG
jgi:hypothetical protein